MRGCLIGRSAAYWAARTALICVRLLGTDLPGMVLMLAGSVWLDYPIQTGGEAVSYPGTQYALGMLITLVQVPGPITDMPPGWTACSASLSVRPCSTCWF